MDIFVLYNWLSTNHDMHSEFNFHTHVILINRTSRQCELHGL